LWITILQKIQIKPGQKAWFFYGRLFMSLELRYLGVIGAVRVAVASNAAGALSIQTGFFLVV
jgi:hypothetical protein